ncbi:unnamed protein product, partial [Brenthis ino]
MPRGPTLACGAPPRAGAASRAPLCGEGARSYVGERLKYCVNRFEVALEARAPGDPLMTKNRNTQRSDAIGQNITE